MTSTTKELPELDGQKPMEYLDGGQWPSRPINGVESHETTSFGTPPWTLGPHPMSCTDLTAPCAAGLLWLVAWQVLLPSNVL